jgi:hypothetical protein
LKAYWQSGLKQIWHKFSLISFSAIEWDLKWWTYAQKTILLPPRYSTLFLMFLSYFKIYIFLLFIIESLDWNRYDRNLVLNHFLQLNGNQTGELMHKRRYCHLQAFSPYFWCFWISSLHHYKHIGSVDWNRYHKNLDFIIFWNWMGIKLVNLLTKDDTVTSTL